MIITTDMIHFVMPRVSTMSNQISANVLSQYKNVYSHKYLNRSLSLLKDMFFFVALKTCTIFLPCDCMRCLTSFICIVTHCIAMLCFNTLHSLLLKFLQSCATRNNDYIHDFVPIIFLRLKTIFFLGHAACRY